MFSELTATPRHTMPNTRPPIDQIALTRARYEALGYTPYQWVHNADTPPFAPLRKPVSESRLALIASGGVYVAGQVAFHHKDDLSLRIVDTDTPTSALRATHFAYDLTDARRDPNVVFPKDTLQRLAKRGVLGELAQRAYTFMGGIYSARKVRDVMAPALLTRLRNDQVDLALLVPV